MRRLLDDDPITKTRTWFVPSDDGSAFTIVSEQNVTLLLEANQAQRNANDKHMRWGEGQLVARIPHVVLDELWRKGILDDEAAFRHWLNDPENRVFRLREGKV
jgi:hypothetical protein